MEIPWERIATAIFGSVVGVASKYMGDAFRRRHRGQGAEEIWILGPRGERLKRIMVKRSRKN